jgi:hypothetical protein
MQCISFARIYICFFTSTLSRYVSAPWNLPLNINVLFRNQNLILIGIYFAFGYCRFRFIKIRFGEHPACTEPAEQAKYSSGIARLSGSTVSYLLLVHVP